MNNQLTKAIFSEEVKLAVFDMPVDKSPGPDGLSCMMKDAEERKTLSAIRISRESPSINHILFADNIMIFSRAGVAEGREVKRILEVYESASGQTVNMKKCSISFSLRTDGRSRKEVFCYIIRRVEERVRGWKGKLLSQVGKKVLIKSITSAIPNYVINYFQLLRGTIDNLNSVMAKFYWASSEGEKGIYWKAWDSLCLEKTKGRLASRILSV
ncbi:hypothetical protein LIER_01312 [Lithospermum erythrorhizon]|uniref:Reverse transcriptase n=1 Tax=Lithospermum erythrorhizon TaxID=34254 RepID=A0AAV3NLM7_LITER